MKKCPKCLDNKDESEFSKNKKQKDGLSRTCKTCMALDQSKSYKKHKETYIQREKKYVTDKKEILDNIKQEKGCEKCGDKRHYILAFHHINPKQKDFNISSKLKNFSWEIIKKEIEKCKILCHNCHYEFHYLERKNNLTIEDYLR